MNRSLLAAAALAMLLTGLAGSSARAQSASMTFFVRIHPARSGFIDSMTPAEGAKMDEHLAYWKSKMAEHALILAGPVPIKTGTFGILILRAADLNAAEELMRNDPSVIAHVTDYEIFPLRLALYEGGGIR